MLSLTIHADGACDPNPGQGGWAAIVQIEGDARRFELTGYDPQTTNNRMELMAAIYPLQQLLVPCRVLLISDSLYLVDGATRWLPLWKATGWRTRRGRDVANQDLWKELDALAGCHFIEWRWVRGHNGHVLNERADQLANAALWEGPHGCA